MNERALIERVSRGRHKVLCLMRFGSHLYGTATENSDTDYKGVFLPTERDVLLQRVPKSMSFNSKTSREEGEKNSSEDVDCELYSLHYFVELACKGETAALDMLHVNKENLLLKSSTWMRLMEHRAEFYTKTLKSFVGYARKQAAKYGLKGSRLNAAQELLKYLEQFPGHQRMINVWENLPVNAHCSFMPKQLGTIETYQFCGKQIQATARVDYIREMVVSFLDTYGERARLAQKNEGVDWKAMSHALRAAYQVEEILTTNNLVYPLKCADYLKAVKQGTVPFKYVLGTLEDLMERLEAISDMSTLPEKADRNRWDNFVVEQMEAWYDW